MRRDDRPLLLTIPEAAALCRVHRNTVWRWVRDGLLPSYRVGVRSLRVRRDDVEAMLRPGREGVVGRNDDAPLAEASRAVEIAELVRDLAERMRLRP